MSEIEIEFISSDVLESAEEGKIQYILDRTKENKILVIEESLSASEEAKLIEATMAIVNKKFPGIEVSTLREKTEGGIKDMLIKMLGGKTGGNNSDRPKQTRKEDQKRTPKDIYVRGIKIEAIKKDNAP